MEGLLKIGFIAAGGAAGAVARYLVNISPLADVFERFPLPTLVINISGSFLIGVLVIVLTDRLAVSENIRFAIIVGFLGAFTTFSTFEMDIYDLAKERFLFSALIYTMLSVVGGFLAVIAGLRLGRTF